MFYQRRYLTFVFWLKVSVVSLCSVLDRKREWKVLFHSSSSLIILKFSHPIIRKAPKLSDSGLKVNPVQTEWLKSFTARTKRFWDLSAYNLPSWTPHCLSWEKRSIENLPSYLCTVVSHIELAQTLHCAKVPGRCEFWCPSSLEAARVFLRLPFFEKARFLSGLKTTLITCSTQGRPWRLRSSTLLHETLKKLKSFLNESAG